MKDIKERMEACRHSNELLIRKSSLQQQLHQVKLQLEAVDQIILSENTKIQTFQNQIHSFQQEQLELEARITNQQKQLEVLSSNKYQVFCFTPDEILAQHKRC